MKLVIIFIVFFIFSLSSLTSLAKFNLENLQTEINNACKIIDSKKDITDKVWVSKKVECLFEKDQLARKEFIKYPNDNKLINYIKKLDKANVEVLKEIIKAYGWLVVSKFGKTIDNKAWLIVQHADHDPMFQASIAFLLEQLFPLGETNPKNYAYLYDRVCLQYQQLGLKQKYGTQIIIHNGKAKLLPFEGTLNDIDKHRKEVGLQPINKYLEEVRGFYSGFLY